MKNSISNYGKYKLHQIKEKEKFSDNPKFLKGTLNYLLNKYILFVSQGSKMKLIDPLGILFLLQYLQKILGLIKEEIIPGEKIYHMKEIYSETKFLHPHTRFLINLNKYLFLSRISIVKYVPFFSLVIAVCTHSPIIFFLEIFFDDKTYTFIANNLFLKMNRFIFNRVKHEDFIFPGIILGFLLIMLT